VIPSGADKGNPFLSPPPSASKFFPAAQRETESRPRSLFESVISIANRPRQAPPARRHAHHSARYRFSSSMASSSPARVLQLRCEPPPLIPQDRSFSHEPFAISIFPANISSARSQSGSSGFCLKAARLRWELINQSSAAKKKFTRSSATASKMGSIRLADRSAASYFRLIPRRRALSFPPAPRLTPCRESVAFGLVRQLFFLCQKWTSRLPHRHPPPVRCDQSISACSPHFCLTHPAGPTSFTACSIAPAPYQGCRDKP